MPRWWRNNHPPTQTKRWIQTNIFEPITAKLKEEGYNVVSIQVDNANPLTTATIYAEKDKAKVHVAFTLPMFADAALAALRQNNNRKTRFILFTYKATLQSAKLRQKESVRVIDFPEPLKQFAAEYEDWANFPTALKVNSARYYQPGDYREVQSPSKQWELSHIHPLIKAQLEARKVPFVRHVPLGQYIADFIVNAEAYTQIIECKRHPFQYNLRCAIEQLLLYEELYRRLFPRRADRAMKLLLALPEGTVTPFVIETALKHRVEVQAIACDPVQTDMIVKKHLAAQVNKLARQISQADCRPIAFTA